MKTAFNRSIAWLLIFLYVVVHASVILDKFNDVKGGSEVYAALWKSLDLHTQVAGARKVIVVLSDGEDDSLAEHSEWAMNSDKPTLREQRMISLLLAALGLFGVMAYLVTQRTSEIGLRINTSE